MNPRTKLTWTRGPASFGSVFTFTATVTRADGAEVTITRLHTSSWVSGRGLKVKGYRVGDVTHPTLTAALAAVESLRTSTAQDFAQDLADKAAARLTRLELSVLLEAAKCVKPGAWVWTRTVTDRFQQSGAAADAMNALIARGLMEADAPRGEMRRVKLTEAGIATWNRVNGRK